MTAALDETPHRNAPLFIGSALFAAGLYLGLSLWSADVTLDPRSAAETCWTGRFGVYAAFYGRVTVGTLPALAAAGLLCLWGVRVVRGGAVLDTWPQVVGGALVVGMLGVLLAAATGGEANPYYGGLVGLAAAPVGTEWLGGAGLFGLGLLGLLMGGALAFGRHIRVVFRACAAAGDGVVRMFTRVGGALGRRLGRFAAGLGAWCAARRAAAEARARDAATASAADASVADDGADAVDIDDDAPAPPAAPAKRSARRAKKARSRPAKSVRDDRVLARPGEYELPPATLLAAPDARIGEQADTIEHRSEVLEQTLAEFKIEGKVVGVESGPRVTMFEVALAPGIRVERIFSLANNITMALKAYNVRIVAPIPGKDTVGIEIPNLENKMVNVREVFAHYDIAENPMAAPMCLGGDITGSPILADLARMPHLLIAGATGSGKSVCLNAILLSFLMTKRPDELKLILVDPKMVELSRFKNVPHLMCPVVTDMKRAAGILEWACAQMDQRYEQMALVGVNNIAKFNALGADEVLRRAGEELTEEELETFPERLPYMVLVIDELADLMLVAGKEVEKSIIRLASKSRAVGIHVILATQRPSVDVITGLIKANMPSRIAFQVASKVDSRTILDANGAENLLGAGDMLYMPPASSKLVRAQGVFVTDEELFAVVDHCKSQARPEFHEELQGPVIGGARADADAERDELFDEAVRAVLESRRGSVSLLQRKLGVGYGRASRIIDQMAEAGVLGPFRDGKAREILMDLEQYEAAFCGADPAPSGTPLSAAAAWADAGEEDDDGEPEEAFSSWDDAPAGHRDDERPRGELPWDE